MNEPRIFVFTGTSGSGRKTIAHRIGAEIDLTHVISCTTREPREREGGRQDYRYLTAEQFEEVRATGGFVQSVVIDKISYGVRKADLEEALLGGHRGVYLVLNKEGASSIKALYGDRVIRLFLYVDKQTVRERLEAKGTSYSVIEQYLDHYTDEVSYRKQCEHVIENVDMNRTLEQLKQIMSSLIG